MTKLDEDALHFAQEAVWALAQVEHRLDRGAQLPELYIGLAGMAHRVADKMAKAAGPRVEADAA